MPTERYRCMHHLESSDHLAAANIESDREQSTVYTTYQVKVNLGKMKTYQVIIPINGNGITIEVDTGMTVMSKSTVATIKNCPHSTKNKH